MHDVDSAKLTRKQRIFAETYIANGRNAAAAYREAYDTKGSPQRVAEDAHALVRHPKIAPIVAVADAQAAARLSAAAARNAVTKERISAELASIAFAAAPDRVSVKDKRAALMDLAKLHGHFVERRETRVVRSWADLTEDELCALAAGG